MGASGAAKAETWRRNQPQRCQRLRERRPQSRRRLRWRRVRLLHVPLLCLGNSLRLVPFLANFTEAQRDPGLEHKLKAEAPAILRWMVQGCQLWLSQGLSMPKAVKEATSEYRSSMDVFQTFLEERCSTDATASVNSQELYDTYTAWCADNGIRLPLRQSLFNQRLEERGYRRKKSNGRNMWAGLRLGQKQLTAKSDDTPSLSCDYQQGDISFSE